MKTIIATLTLSLITGAAFAQKVKESEVPASVKESFSKKYAGAKAEKWEKENGNYEAEFDLNKTETSALFDASGNFKEQEQEIRSSALPAGVTAYCTKSFAGWKLSEASKITAADGKVSYEAEMKKGKEHFDAIFDDKGNFEKKGEVEKGEEEKD
jgi:hypothetical protein